MDDNKFSLIVGMINKITAQYQLPNGSPGHLKHHQYADEYDKIFEKNRLTKKEFIEEINRRIAARDAL